MRKIIRDKAGVNPGSVAIVMAVIAILIMSVVVYTTNRQEDDESKWIYKTGILKGCDPVVLGNETFRLSDVNTEYLFHLLGQNITLIVEECSYTDYDYRYVGAYLNVEE